MFFSCNGTFWVVSEYLWPTVYSTGEQRCGTGKSSQKSTGQLSHSLGKIEDKHFLYRRETCCSQQSLLTVKTVFGLSLVAVGPISFVASCQEWFPVWNMQSSLSVKKTKVFWKRFSLSWHSSPFLSYTLLIAVSVNSIVAHTSRKAGQVATSYPSHVLQ